jgi:hypothetical protein
MWEGCRLLWHGLLQATLEYITLYTTIIVSTSDGMQREDHALTWYKPTWCKTPLNHYWISTDDSNVDNGRAWNASKWAKKRPVLHTRCNIAWRSIHACHLLQANSHRVVQASSPLGEQTIWAETANFHYPGITWATQCHILASKLHFRNKVRRNGYEIDHSKSISIS